MKKRILCLCLLLSFLGSALPAYAAEGSQASGSQEEYEYFEDGSYCVTVIADESGVDSAARSVTTVTKSKTLTYYSSTGTALWYLKVTGTFTYGNGSSSCNSSSMSAGVYSSDWSVSNKRVSRDETSATASATFTLAATIVTPSVSTTKSVTLTCSATGEFS